MTYSDRYGICISYFHRYLNHINFYLIAYRFNRLFSLLHNLSGLFQINSKTHKNTVKLCKSPYPKLFSPILALKFIKHKRKVYLQN